MGIIKIPDRGDKDIEYSSLETHVVMSLERYKAMEIRLNRIEEDMANIHAQLRSNKLYIIGGASTVLAGIFSTLVTLIVAVQKFN
jgi:hypothetical protein